MYIYMYVSTCPLTVFTVSIENVDWSFRIGKWPYEIHTILVNITDDIRTYVFLYIAYLGSSEVPCSLVCLAENENFYAVLGILNDGTHCQPNPKDSKQMGICITGKCHVRKSCSKLFGSFKHVIYI